MEAVVKRESLTAVCRRDTNLSAMQIDLLNRMHLCFPFIADLAHAHLSLYVRTRQQNRLLVLRHYKPHTFFSQIELAAAGTVVASQEEPLVTYAMDTGKSIHGKREWTLNSTLDMYTYPIFMGSQVVAVISLETSSGYVASASYAQVLDTIRMVMEESKKAIDADIYSRISPGTGILIADKSNRIIYANMSATRLYRALGINHLLGCRLPDRELSAMLHKETIDSRRPYEKEIQIGDFILVQRDIKLEEAGVQRRRIMLLADVSEIRKKEREIKIKTAVIQEIHHRVKNNLQTIASLLRLQARRSKSSEVKAALQESTNRILSMSVVHEFLSRQDAEEIRVMEVTKNIIKTVTPNMLPADFRLSTEFHGPEVVLPSKSASNLAVIINELILNSIEHGFEERNHGLIGLKTAATETGYVLDLYDDGRGLPEGFAIEKSRSLGLQIIRTLVGDDMGGSIELFNQQGTHARLYIPFNPEGGEY